MGLIADYSRGEPEPVKNNSRSIHDLVIFDIETTYSGSWASRGVIEMLKERKDFGLQKYGTILQARNGRNPINDALEEIGDLLVYLKQALEEADHESERKALTTAYKSALALSLQIEVIHNWQQIEPKNYRKT